MTQSKAKTEGESMSDLSEPQGCWTCNGSGKVRNNYTNEFGSYVFHKEICPDCKGTGELSTAAYRALIAMEE